MQRMARQPDAVSLGYWQDRDPMEALVTAQLADELGYRELWIGEMATFDAFAIATAVGSRAESISLTVGPLAPGIRDPMAMAMGIASVATLTARPTQLAIGSSSPVVVARWHGRPYERLALGLRETVGALRPLLGGDRASFTGEVVRTDGYRLRLPAPGSSITVAAFGPGSIRVAAELSDRMVVNLCTPGLVAELREHLRTAAEGCDRPVPPLAAWVPAAVDPNDEAITQLRRAIVSYLAAPGYAEMFERAGFPESVAVARSGARPATVLEEVPRELVDAVGIVGDEAQCRARIDEFTHAGVDEIVIVPATAGDPGGRRTLEVLAP
jgi:probable F420-dependent oxidoreductase